MKKQSKKEITAIMAALHHTQEVEPDLHPVDHETLVKGYVICGKQIEKGCTTTSSHSKRTNEYTTSQKGISLYSTRLRALKAMRQGLEMEFAKQLHSIDLDIQAEMLELNELKS